VLVDTDEFVCPNAYLPHASAPDLAIPGSTLQWLNKRVGNRTDFQAMICLLIPRLQMTNMETDATILQQSIPAGFNASQFLITRRRVHSGHEIHMGHNLDGKSIINVQWLASATNIPISVRAHSAHKIVPEFCSDTYGDRLTHPDSWLLIEKGRLRYSKLRWPLWAGSAQIHSYIVYSYSIRFMYVYLIYFMCNCQYCQVKCELTTCKYNKFRL
jgi:hypothetical protein